MRSREKIKESTDDFYQRDLRTIAEILLDIRNILNNLRTAIVENDFHLVSKRRKK